MWFLPKNSLRKTRDVIWSKERSPLLAAYHAIKAQGDAGAQPGVTPGMEEVVERAARRGRLTWQLVMAAVLSFWVFAILFLGLPALSHIVVAAVLGLCVAEIFKLAFVAWHCRTGGTYREFLRELSRRPAILFR